MNKIIAFPGATVAPPPNHRPVGRVCEAEVKPGLLRRSYRCRRPARGRWNGKDLCFAHFHEEVRRDA